MSARVLPAFAVANLALASAAGWFLASWVWPTGGQEAPPASAIAEAAENPFDASPAAGESVPVPRAEQGLFEEVFPRRGPARPPYLPARYDPGLKGPDEKIELLAELRARAAKRQDRLEQAWKDSPYAQSERARREAAMLRYAFGAGPLDPAMAAARAIGPDGRMRLARFLLAECRFSEAIRELAALADLPTEAEKSANASRESRGVTIADEALAILVSHQIQREALARQVPLVPLDFDLDGYLRRRADDRKTRLLIEGLRHAASGTKAAEETLEVEVIEELGLPEVDLVADWRWDRDGLEAVWHNRRPAAADLARPYPVTSGNDFVLYQRRVDWLSRSRAELALHSEFNGPVQFRLYRFDTPLECDQATAARLAAMKPMREWTATAAPLRDNNRGEPKEASVVIEGLDEGHFLLTAEARYAPMLAACTFCVDHVALYLRAGPDQGVAVAVDRRTGRPVSGLPLEAVIVGSPNLQRAVKGVRLPDFKQVLHLRTGPDGAAALPLDAGREDYDCRVSVSRAVDGADSARMSGVELARPVDQPGQPGSRILVWLAEPIVRPGGAAHFKGIVRQFDGRRLADHNPAGPREVRVRAITFFVSPQLQSMETETLWEGTCPVSPAGTFDGSFPIPRSAAAGRVRFTVDGDSAQPFGALTIAEFRLGTYDVDLQLPHDKVAGGEALSGCAKVQYLTGKPAVGAEVEIVLETGAANPPAVTVLADATGQAAFSMPVPQDDRDRSYELRATAMDASGQTYTRSTRVSCMASAFRVTFPEAVGPAVRGKPFPLRVKAAGWDGQPVRGATVTVDASDRAATTDDRGEATLELKLQEPRTVTVTAIFKGRVVRATTAQMDVRPEKGAKTTGHDEDEGRPFTIRDWQMPARIDAGSSLEVCLALAGPQGRRATVLVCAESNRLHAWQVLDAGPGEHLVRFDTQREWPPCIQVAVTVLDGRRQETRTREVYLRPTDRLLTLTVETDKLEYRPGERCRAVVRATDRRGQPVAGADISLGVIDEAVYLAQEDPTPDVLDYFYRNRVPFLCDERFDKYPPPVHSAWFFLGPRDAWGYYPGIWRPGPRRMLYGAGGGASLTERRRQEVTVRKDFATAAHWVARLVTGADGRAQAEFTLPESITAWRFTARGVTPDTLVGDVRIGRRTILPVSVELALPRGLRVGDRIEIPVVVHNNTDEPREVSGAVRFADQRELAQPAMRLAPHGHRAWRVPFVAKDTAPLRITAVARDKLKGDNDAQQKTLAAIPRGVRFVAERSGPLDRKAEVRFDAPPGGFEGPVLLCVRREPGLAGPVASAMDELIQYPYGCVEQTMSRFMPAVVAAEAMKQAGIDCPAAKRLPDVLEKGLARLAELQHANGGWGWWQHDETNSFMTAYVLEGLALCRQAGNEVDPVMIARARACLEKQMDSPLLFKFGPLRGQRPGCVADVSLHLFAVYALAVCDGGADAGREATEKLRARLRALEEGHARPNPIEMVLLADAWRLAGDAARAKAILRKLKDKPVRVSSDRASIVLAAGLLRVGSALEPDDSRWPMLAHRLVAARQGTAWGDTLTTSAAVRGLAPMIRPKQVGEAPADVLVDGRRLGRLGPQSGDVLEVGLETALAVAIVPARPGGGNSYRVRLEGRLKSPLPTPERPAVTLRTTVTRLRPERAVLAPDAAGKLAVPRGVTLEVEVEVKLDKPVSFARLTVPRPCGVELIRAPKPGDGIVATEERDDGLHFFVPRWEAGTHRAAFLVRAEVAGTIAAPPAELAPMYDEPLPTAAFGPSEWVVGP